MVKVIDSKKSRIKRRKRIRAKISGTAACPRLSVFRSAKHIYAQIIDDEAGKTLCSASTMEKSFEGFGGNAEAAKKVGLALAEKAKDPKAFSSKDFKGEREYSSNDSMTRLSNSRHPPMSRWKPDSPKGRMSPQRIAMEKPVEGSPSNRLRSHISRPTNSS